MYSDDALHSTMNVSSTPSIVMTVVNCPLKSIKMPPTGGQENVRSLLPLPLPSSSVVVNTCVSVLGVVTETCTSWPCGNSPINSRTLSVDAAEKSAGASTISSSSQEEEEEEEEGDLLELLVDLADFDDLQDLADFNVLENLTALLRNNLGKLMSGSRRFSRLPADIRPVALISASTRKFEMASSFSETVQSLFKLANEHCTKQHSIREAKWTKHNPLMMFDNGRSKF